MGLANKASFMLVIGTLFITGCTITQKHVEPEQVEPTTDVKPQGQPNPKPRPKSEPLYPPASTVIAWHAAKCGGFKAASDKANYVGENELKRLFESICLLAASEPEKALNQLEKSDHAFYWPDDIKQYLWLQKQYLQQNLAAQQAKQALSDEMEKTLSSLATIEQQLLLREETKEQ
ncbi:MULTISPECIES: hypothetical protein [Pseudoalteromonas]|uniref:hypothetical protein n=1 Tax=Pseudoalteromonas TaxID=53246 RepID=UPI00272C6C27|nr:hypothetical protein [Pseudoalteromonas sp.]